MNPNRRSMAAALQTSNLPPEALSIINAGTPQSQTPSIVATSPTLPKEPEKAESPRPVLARDEATPSVKLKPRKEVAETPALVSVNYRVPAGIPLGLLKASSERKMKKIRPFTQQDIVAEALTDWLKKTGYWQVG